MISGIKRRSFLNPPGGAGAAAARGISIHCNGMAAASVKRRASIIIKCKSIYKARRAWYGKQDSVLYKGDTVAFQNAGPHKIFRHMKQGSQLMPSAQAAPFSAISPVGETAARFLARLFAKQDGKAAGGTEFKASAADCAVRPGKKGRILC